MSQLASQTKQENRIKAAPESGILQRAAISPTITPVHSGILQRCSNGVECAECRAKRLERESLQRAAVSPAPVNTVPPIVHDVLNSPGQSLDAGARAFMEPRFGHDFSGVRVHTDARAAESARSVNALAYTVGRNVVFGAGQYAPGTGEGRKLLAHELTHVVQQSNQLSILRQNLTAGPVDSPLEREADHVADTMEHDIVPQAKENISSVITHTLQPMIQRRQDAFGKECPDTVALAEIKPIPQFNKEMFDAGYRTYLGLVTNMKVGPKSSYNSSITEVLEVKENTCGNKGNMDKYEPCGPKRHVLTVGETCGGDTLTKTSFPCSKTTFVDLHRTRDKISLLQGTGKTECRTKCLQRYGCGGEEIGRFYVTRNFKASEFIDGKNKIPITVGTIEKEIASK
jgi:Domain of unknown function (DUF4157)